MTLMFNSLNTIRYQLVTNFILNIFNEILGHLINNVVFWTLLSDIFSVKKINTYVYF